MKRTWAQTEEYGQLGIIESVTLRNFMCHDNLSFNFDPHMNFIIGQNGSGKSAVLTGIILALGGKSGATGRHSNVKGFIKTGKHASTVSVTLKNCGPEAYKPSEYGSKITVERNFNSDGVSHYKLKSQSGQIISTSKEELTNILNIMDIQIENPITVLTQEISRNFLVSKNSKGHKLFQLFYSGTGLARVEEDYNKAMQLKEDTAAELELKKAALPDMQKEIKSLRSLLDRTSKVKELKLELLWAIVIKFEKERDEAEKDLLKIQNDITAVNKNLSVRQAEHAKVTQKLNQDQTDKRESNEKMDGQRKKLQEFMAKRNDVSSIVRDKKGTFCRYEREVNKFSSEASSLENMINEIKLKNQSDVDEIKQKHAAKMDALKQLVTQTENEINKLDEKKDSFFETIAGMNKMMDTYQAEFQDASNSLKMIEREKQNLMAGLKNRIDVFGPEMKPLLQEIKNASRAGMFKVEPRGPIGLYLNVRNPEWNFAVQECLKIGFLKTFCCDNLSDADLLMKIINKHYASSRMKPSIVTSKFVSKIFNVDKFKTNVGHPTLLDMLEIDDPVIANCLIDQKQIENILLIADEKAAVNLMMDHPPRNCISAYTLSGDQICHSPYRYYSCRNNNQVCILKTVNQDDILKKDAELHSLNSELRKIIATKDKLQQELNKTEEGKKQNDRKINHKQADLRQLQMKIKEEETAYEEPKDINCLQSDLDKLLIDKSLNEEKLFAVQEEIRVKEEEISSYEKTINDCKSALKEENTTFQDLTTSIDEGENKIERLNSAITKLEAQLRNLEPIKQEREDRLKNITAYTKTAKKTADDTGQRVETRRSVDKIRQLLKETQKVQEKKNYDQETLIAEYEEKVERFNKAKTELERQERTNNQIGKMMEKRFQEFKKICHNNVVCLTCNFTGLLKENNFSGYPEVNLEANTLEIYAEPEKMNTKAGRGKQNLAQLSGGERSYVTIAFLLSLWDRIRMPFRILDEYDVFMDSNNRHLSINLLINTVKSNKNIQYIFLSPLELPPMPNSSHVKVHKMPAPKK